jgi:hypothetical protein
MNSTIKKIEEIGQNTSLKKHDNLIEMLIDLNIEKTELNNVDIINGELICGLFPADDSDDDNTDDNSQEEE